MTTTHNISLPLAGITLLPPWWAFILWADKRIENRAPSVAGRIKGWRGVFAFGASKVESRGAREEAIDALREYESTARWNGKAPTSLPQTLWQRGGHIVGCAELLDVRQNGFDPRDKWAGFPWRRVTSASVGAATSNSLPIDSMAEQKALHAGERASSGMSPRKRIRTPESMIGRSGNDAWSISEGPLRCPGTCPTRHPQRCSTILATLFQDPILTPNRTVRVFLQ